MPLRRLAHLLLAATLLASPAVLLAKTLPPADHWVGTWAAASVPQPNKDNLFQQDTTLRDIVHVTLAGPLVRVILSNEFGSEPLRIGAVHIAPSAGNGAISLFGANALTFSGHPEITIPPGARVISDPAGLALKPLSDIAVSIFIPAQTVSTLSVHDLALETSYLAPGNVVGQANLPNPTPIHTWPILRGIETRVSGKDAAVLCIGDSITDGFRSLENTNTRWPDILAARLSHSRKHDNLAVLNLGISGNRVLAPGAGPAALARFDRDILTQSGARFLILLEGINDIGNGYKTNNPQPNPSTAQDLIAAYQQIITRAHAHNIAVIGATITPYMGAGYSSPAGEQVRQAVNNWTRSSGNFDGVIDFDAVTRDKSNQQALSPAADSGDHLHPSTAGYKIMGDSIDLDLFTTQKKAVPPQAKVAPPSSGSANPTP